MKTILTIIVGLFSGFIGSIFGPIISAKLDYKYYKKKELSGYFIELVNNTQKELLTTYLDIKLFLNENKKYPEKLLELGKFVPIMLKIDMIFSTYSNDKKLIEISRNTKNVIVQTSQLFEHRFKSNELSFDDSNLVIEKLSNYERDFINHINKKY